MRRRLIVQVTNILPSCDIFKEKAFYPRKYFDDLMLETQGVEEDLMKIHSMDQLKTMKENMSKKKLGSTATLAGHAGSSTNFGSDGTRTRTLGHSPTEKVPLTSNTLVLPELRSNIAQKLQFGMGDKGNYDNISDVQQQTDMKMAREFLESDLGYKKKGRKRGVHATMLTGPFKPTDIERNSVLSYGKTGNGLDKGTEGASDVGGLFVSPT